MSLEFTVPDMACIACAETITKAVKAIDPAATITANTDTKIVKIVTDRPASQLKQAIQQAGYNPQ
jgi:copper chaperone